MNILIFICSSPNQVWYFRTAIPMGIRAPLFPNPVIIRDYTKIPTPIQPKTLPRLDTAGVLHISIIPFADFKILPCHFVF